MWMAGQQWAAQLWTSRDPTPWTVLYNIAIHFKKAFLWCHMNITALSCSRGVSLPILFTV